MEGFDFLRVGRSSGLREKENQKRPNKQHHQTIQTQVNSAHNSHTRQQQPLSIYTNLLTPAPITIAVTLSATYHKFCSCFSSLPPFLSQPITCYWALENVSTSIQQSVQDSAACLFVYCYRGYQITLIQCFG